LLFACISLYLKRNPPGASFYFPEFIIPPAHMLGSIRIIGPVSSLKRTGRFVSRQVSHVFLFLLLISFVSYYLIRSLVSLTHAAPMFATLCTIIPSLTHAPLCSFLFCFYLPLKYPHLHRIIIHHSTDHALHRTLTHSRKLLLSLFTRSFSSFCTHITIATTQMASSIMRIGFDMVPFLHLSTRYHIHPPSCRRTEMGTNDGHFIHVA